MLAPPARLTYVGHATTLIELDGLRILTDPVLRRRVLHLYNHGLRPHRSNAVADLVLISHAHWDHLDLPSLRLFDRNIPLIAPRGVAPIVRRLGFTTVTEMAVGDEVRIGRVAIRATYADHGGARYPLRRAPECLGYLVEGSYTLFFPGDTDLFAGMADLGAALPGGLDVALLPVWGWGPTLGPGHMDPRRAAEAAQLLRPRLAVPIHWGTLYPLGFRRLAPHLLVEPPLQFRSHIRELAPDVAVQILHPGHSIELAAARPPALPL
jgi:L-ascorbate metabolism protein UlaG (beta-lactamase superfamily)